MLPLKFYQLHFQVRKNISTSTRFQKHLSSGQQTLPHGGRGLHLPCWGRCQPKPGKEQDQGNRCRSADSSLPCPPGRRMRSPQQDLRSFLPLGFGLGFLHVNSLLRPPGLPEPKD